MDPRLNKQLIDLELRGSTSTVWGGISGSITEQEDLQEALDQRQPRENGFPNRTDSIISVDDSTRTFTITPTADSFDVFVGSTRFTKTTAQSVQWDDTNGDFYFYFDTEGVLQAADDFDPQIITLYAFCGFIYFDNVNQESLLFLDERHGSSMSSTTHSYLHNVAGTQYDTGLALSNMVVDGDGSSDTHAQFGVTDGVIWDEDIRAAITDGSPQDIAPTAHVPIFYLVEGGEWRRDTATSLPVVTTGTGRLAYNEFTGVVWEKAEVTNNQFVVYHYFASTDTRTPIFGIMGQGTYTGVSAAQEGALEEILSLELGALGSLSTEWVAIASVIFQTSNSYSNSVKARIRSTADNFDYVDWRDTSRTAGGSAAANTSWGSITGTLSNQTDLQAAIDAAGSVRESGTPFYDGSTALYVVYGSDEDWEVIKTTKTFHGTTGPQIGPAPTTLTALQGLTYS